MKINFRHYENRYGFNDDFFKIFVFLKRYGAKGLNENWHWGRWEWLIGHPNLKEEMLPIIGIWECDGDIAGIATHDMGLGYAYIICSPKYEFLKPEMLKYAEKNLSLNGTFEVSVNDEDIELIKLLEKNNYCKGEEIEVILSLNCNNGAQEYSLPEGFTVSSFEENRDINKYNRVIWKGFNHEGEAPVIDETYFKIRPHANSSLSVFIVAPNGEYASHCGMWYDADREEAYIEPVVTIPEYRNLGLAKAAVYESVNRCILMGAKSAQVISNQQFYYRIGFEKSSVYTFWKRK